MINKSTIALLALSLFACTNNSNTYSNTQAPNSQSQLQVQVKVNTAFDQFKEQYLRDVWKQYPDYGVYVGFYDYDDQLNIPNAEFAARQKAFAKTTLALLESFDKTKLSASNMTDYALIKNGIESTLWNQDVFKSWQWDPSTYNVAGTFGVILNTDYKPLDERLMSVLSRVKRVPAYYEAAIQNITNPTIEHTELAILQNKGALGIFSSSIPKKLAESSLSEEQQQAFSQPLAQAVQAIEGYISFLTAKKEGLTSETARNFRIGEKLYEEKFALDIFTEFSGKELYEKALKSKDLLHQEMISISHKLWPKYFPNTEKPNKPLVMVKTLIDHLSVKHVEREDFVDEIRRQMPIIQQFIIDKDLLDVDQSRPLVVRETPEYMRGFAGASVSAPGPYDATAKTYYNVTPLDHYSEEQAESYLREYNHWILQVLNIHEAMPGHYTQLVHANKSPSKIKSIFGNGAMIEGWAVYSERMMLEEGYGNNEPELWLMYSKWNLRVVANTIIDYGIQVLDMSEDEVMDVLVNQAFQEQTEASQKWRRATLSQVQLTSYFNGYAEIYEFRESLKEKMGEQFDLKDFHNKFLSYGNAPVPLIKTMMLKDLGLE